MSPSKSNKKIALICLGGTILSIAPSPVDEFYSISSMSINELLDQLPDINGVSLEAQHPFSVMSYDISKDELMRVAHLINDVALRDDIDGVIVVQGTDTIEEVSFFANLIIKTKKPIVFTGSMRPVNGLGYEGIRNIYNAILIASEQQASGLGVLVTFNDFIYSARDLIKSNPSMIAAFSTNMAGPMGYVLGGQVTINYQPTFLHTWKSCFDINKLKILPNVMIDYGTIGADGAILKAVDFTTIQGIVSAGMGKGYQPTKKTEWLFTALEHDIAVVRCSRSGVGIVNPDPEQPADFIAGYSFSPAKAKLLLQVGLSHTQDVALLQEYFATF